MVILLYWLVVDQPLWKMMDFVSWDDEIANWMENKIHVPNHQPESVWNNNGDIWWYHIPTIRSYDFRSIGMVLMGKIRGPPHDLNGKNRGFL